MRGAVSRAAGLGAPKGKRVDLLTIAGPAFSHNRLSGAFDSDTSALLAARWEPTRPRSMPSGAEGFDTNGRPDDLLKRITYNANNYGKGAFLFADADAGPEDESRARRNRFPKRENLELEQKLYETMERQADEVVKARLAEAEKAAKEFNWDVYVDPDANAPVEADARPGILRPNGDGCGAAMRAALPPAEPVEPESALAAEFGARCSAKEARGALEAAGGDLEKARKLLESLASGRGRDRLERKRSKDGDKGKRSRKSKKRRRKRSKYDSSSGSDCDSSSRSSSSSSSSSSSRRRKKRSKKSKRRR